MKKVNKKVSAIADYQELFKTPQGENVLRDLAKSHYVLKSTFDENPYLVALREGERNVVLRIFSILGTDVIKLYKQIEEQERNYDAT